MPFQMMGLKCAKRKPFVDKKVHHHGMYFYGTRKHSIFTFFDKVRATPSVYKFLKAWKVTLPVGGRRFHTCEKVGK